MKFIILTFFTFHFTIGGLLLTVSAQPTQQWAARYNRPSGSSSIPNQMAIDKVGNVYVLGNLPNQSGTGGMLTIKYNSSGDTVWTRSYNIGTGSVAENTAITADSIGNVYVTGFVGFGFGPYDIVTIKYNTAGVQEWVKTYDRGSGISDTPGGIKIGRDGMIYVAGKTGTNTLLIKYNSNGDSVWVRQYGQSGFTMGVGYLEFDSQNNIYAGGYRINSSTNELYYLVLKYTPASTLIWPAFFTINGSEYLRAMTIDRFGNCFMTGDGFSGYTTVKFDSSGNQQWVRTYLDNNGSSARGIVTDTNGNCYVTGASSLGGANYDYLTIKYKPVGDSVWVRRYNGPGNFQDVPYDIDIDDSSNIYITGSSYNTGNIIEYATLKYNTNGIEQWVMRYQGIAHSVLVDSFRNVYVTGRSDSAGLPGYVTIKYAQPPSGINLTNNEVAKTYSLYQNYPNPFNPSTKIRFDISASPIPSKGGEQVVILRIYDILGREVSVLVNEKIKKGSYEIIWNAEKVSSGIYFYQLVVDNKIIEAKKMILNK